MTQLVAAEGGFVMIIPLVHYVLRYV